MADFARRGRAVLLETAAGVETALGHIAGAAGLDELRIQSENFFLRAARFQSGLVGLRGLHLRLGPRGLRTDVGVIQLQQELALLTWSPSLTRSRFTVVAMGAWASKFWIGSTLPLVETTLRIGPRWTDRGTDLERSSDEVGIKLIARCQHGERKPNPTPADGGFELFVDANQLSFRMQAGITVSSNLPFRRLEAPTAKRS